MGVTTAVDLVENLLAGPIPVREAIPAAPVASPTPRSRLRVFGPDSPSKGWFYTGPDPLGDFIRYKRGKDAVIRGPDDQEKYINFFTRNGYTFVFKEGSGFKIRSKSNLNIAQDGIQALEQTMGLSPSSVIDFNGNVQPASEIIYGQPNRGTHEPGQADTIDDPAKRLIKATFGGAYGEDGQFQTGNSVNVQVMRSLLTTGHAFVIKYQSGSFNVIMPERYRFKPEAIRSLEKKVGLNRNSVVQWFIGAINPNEAIHTTAAEAIYGERA